MRYNYEFHCTQPHCHTFKTTKQDHEHTTPPTHPRTKFSSSGFDGLGLELVELDFSVVESGGFNFTASLEAAQQLVVSPADGGGEVTEAAVLAASLQAKSADGAGHNLHVCVRVDVRSYKISLS